MCVDLNHHSPSTPLGSITPAARGDMEPAGNYPIPQGICTRQETLTRKDEALRLRMIVWLTRHSRNTQEELRNSSLQVLRSQVAFVECMYDVEFREDSVR